MVRIIWLVEAQKDLKSIFDFIASVSPRFAKFQVKEIKQRVKVLETFPRAGKIVEEIGNTKIREIVFSNYRIVYRINTEREVLILMIHHGARDFSERIS